MALNSIHFFGFVTITAIIYFLVPKRIQWIVLLISSYVFYLLSAKAAVVLILITSASTFFAGLLIERSNEKLKVGIAQAGREITREQKSKLTLINKKEKRIYLYSSLGLIFGILCLIKISNSNTSVGTLLSHFSVDINNSLGSILLPIGISFYTFQSAGYLIDLSRGNIHADRNFAKFALFISFFPQMVQGPISRYDDLGHQLYEPHDFNYNRVKFGSQLILWGLFKKMVIADRLVFAVNSIFNNYKEYGGFIIFIGAALYSFQVYCDFSGGIDLTRGVAQIFGIILPDNFKRPFFSTSIEDFWRRWHITLSSWMRDYIFYPLSLSKGFTKLGRLSRKIFGNYVGRMIPTFLAMLITFITVGIWHGPETKFVAYGFYNGFLIITGILLGPLLNNFLEKFHIRTNTFSWRLYKVLGTFFLVTLGRYFSRAESLTVAWSMLKWTIKKYNPWVFFDGTLLKLGLDSKDIGLLFVCILVMLVVSIYQEKGIDIRQRISEQNLVFRWSIYLLAVFFVLIFGIYGIEYNSIDFIYRGF